MYVLHAWPDTASLIVRLVLEELGQPYTYRQIDRAAGELDSPAYRALQPLGKIPAMETPDGPMFETAAILMYLAERHGALMPPPGDPARASFLTWYFFVTSNIHPPMLQAYYPEREASGAAVDKVVEAAGAKLHRAFTVLETMLTRDRPEWLSESPSILGYYLAVLVRWLSDSAAPPAARLDLDDFPRLGQIMAALEARPAAQACARTEGLGPHPFTLRSA